MTTSPLTPETLAEMRYRLETNFGTRVVAIAPKKLAALLALAERVCPECWGTDQHVYGLPDPECVRCAACAGSGWRQK